MKTFILIKRPNAKEVDNIRIQLKYPPLNMIDVNNGRGICFEASTGSLDRSFVNGPKEAPVKC